MLTPEEANKLKEKPEWQALEAHITECIAALDSCSSISDEVEHVDKVARGRKEAVKILHTILEPFQYDPKPEQDKRNEALRKLGIK